MKKILLFVAAFFVANLARAQWEPDVRLTNNPAVSQTSLNNAWCIAASGDTVHAVWHDQRDGNKEIYYKRSIDAGLTWGTDVRLTNSSGISWDPSVAVRGSIVYIVFEDYRNGINNGEIYFKCSLDGGNTWGPDVRLTNNASGSILPLLAISDSIVHVTWQDERDTGHGEIYYKSSTDGGITWGADMRLTNDPGYSGIPSVATVDSDVHIVWEDDRDGPNGKGSIYYKRSTDGGITWSADTRPTNSNVDVWDPSVAVSDSLVHVVYFDATFGDIYYIHTTDGGTTWGAPKKLTNAAGISRYPSIAVSGSLVHVTWEDSRDGNFEIYYKRSIDGGANWEPDTRLSNASYNSLFSSVTVSDSVIHVVWYDKRDFNDEIYYKRNSTGNTIVGLENNLISKSAFIPIRHRS